MDLEEALRRHVEVLTVEIGRRTPFPGDGLERARRYIHQTFEAAGSGWKSPPRRTTT